MGKHTAAAILGGKMVTLQGKYPKSVRNGPRVIIIMLRRRLYMDSKTFVYEYTKVEVLYTKVPLRLPLLYLALGTGRMSHREILPFQFG